jgi:hypothetical protein
MGHAEIVASTAATERRYAIVVNGVLSVRVGQSMFVSGGAGRKISALSVHDAHPALCPVSYSRRPAACRGARAHRA